MEAEKKKLEACLWLVYESHGASTAVPKYRTGDKVRLADKGWQSVETELKQHLKFECASIRAKGPDGNVH